MGRGKSYDQAPRQAFSIERDRRGCERVSGHDLDARAHRAPGQHARIQDAEPMLPKAFFTVPRSRVSGDDQMPHVIDVHNCAPRPRTGHPTARHALANGWRTSERKRRTKLHTPTMPEGSAEPLHMSAGGRCVLWRRYDARVSGVEDTLLLMAQLRGHRIVT